MGSGASMHMVEEHLMPDRRRSTNQSDISNLEDALTELKEIYEMVLQIDENSLQIEEAIQRTSFIEAMKQAGLEQDTMQFSLDEAKWLIGKWRKTIIKMLQVSHQNTPRDNDLLQACLNGELEVVQQCISQNANPHYATDKEFGNSCLHQAIKGNHLEICKYLVEVQKVSLSSTESCGMTPLMLATVFNNVDMLRYLLEVGADIDEPTHNDASAIYFACQNNHMEALRFLTERGADLNKATNTGATPLYIACEEGNFDVVKHLIEVQADVHLPLNNGASPTCIACENGYLPIVQLLVEGGGADVNQCTNDGTSPLYIASEKNHLDIVKYLLERGADVNAPKDNGITPLYIACQCATAQLVTLLIDSGADLSIVNLINGNTPLHAVCIDGKANIVDLLCAKGADVESRDFGLFTPLCLASQMGKPNLVEILLQKNADPSSFGWNGNSSLHIASWCGHIAAVRSMLALEDLSLDCQNIYGCTPLHLAAMNGKLGVVQALLQKSADINMKDKNNNTPLHYALIGHHCDISRTLLLQENIDIGLQNNSGATALSLLQSQFPEPFSQLIVEQPNLILPEAPAVKIQTTTELLASIACKTMPEMSVNNVKLIKMTTMLTHGEFPSYSFCEQNGWHISGDTIQSSDKILFVSHPWCSTSHPDPDKTQFEILQLFINQCPHSFEYVWLDYSCIFQDDGSELALVQTNSLPLCLWVSTHLIVIPLLSPIQFLMDPRKYVLTSNIADYVQRAWCMLEFIACYLTGKSITCCFKVGNDIRFQIFDRPEGAASDLGFDNARAKVWEELLGEVAADFMAVKWDVLKSQWEIQEPCRILTLMLQIFCSDDQLMLAIVEKAKTMSLSMEDVNADSSLQELWFMLGTCTKEADKIIIFRLLLFVGYHCLGAVEEGLSPPDTLSPDEQANSFATYGLTGEAFNAFKESLAQLL